MLSRDLSEIVVTGIQAEGGERLPKLIELLFIDAQLGEDPIEKRSTNLAAAVDGNGGCSAVRMIPPLVTTGLADSFETEFGGNAAEFIRTRTRHERFR